MDRPVSYGVLCDVYFAKLDESSHAPKDVTVECLRIDPNVDDLSKAAIVSGERGALYFSSLTPGGLETPKCARTFRLLSQP